MSDFRAGMFPIWEVGIQLGQYRFTTPTGNDIGFDSSVFAAVPPRQRSNRDIVSESARTAFAEAGCVVGGYVGRSITVFTKSPSCCAENWLPSILAASRPSRSMMMVCSVWVSRPSVFQKFIPNIPAT